MKRYALLLAALCAVPHAAFAQDTGTRPIAFAALPLQQAETAALAHSPDVAAAEAMVAQNNAALGAARGSIGPSLTTAYNQAPQGGPLNTTITQSLTTVGVSTTLGDIVAYSPLVAAAVANLRSAQASLLAAQRAERVKVIGLYYDALKARSIADARDQALTLAQQQRDAAIIRAKAGDAPRLDVVRANVAVAKATADDEMARATAANAAEALRVETQTTSPLDRTEELPLPNAQIPAPADAVSQALAQRADLRAAADDTAAAQAAARAAHRQTIPAVTVGAGYTTGVDSGVAVHGPSVNVSMAVPLGSVARDNALQKDAAAAQQRAKQQAAERQVALDVAATVRTLAASQRATAASTQAREQAQAELQATQLGYRNGATSSLELASARDTYTLAVVDELSALYDQLKGQATLALETGP